MPCSTKTAKRILVLLQICEALHFEETPDPTGQWGRGGDTVILEEYQPSCALEVFVSCYLTSGSGRECGCGGEQLVVYVLLESRCCAAAGGFAVTSQQ